MTHDTSGPAFPRLRSLLDAHAHRCLLARGGKRDYRRRNDLRTFEERKEEWKRAFLDAGHEFHLKEPKPEFDGPDGPPIDWFVVDEGFHNGPRCVKCGWFCCHHCTAISDIPKCKGERE